MNKRIITSIIIFGPIVLLVIFIVLVLNGYLGLKPTF
jgi:hypothetical protein